jgi:hypothetical protein
VYQSGSGWISIHGIFGTDIHTECTFTSGPALAKSVLGELFITLATYSFTNPLHIAASEVTLVKAPGGHLGER